MTTPPTGERPSEFESQNPIHANATPAPTPTKVSPDWQRETALVTSSSVGEIELGEAAAAPAVTAPAAQPPMVRATQAEPIDGSPDAPRVGRAVEFGLYLDTQAGSVATMPLTVRLAFRRKVLGLLTVQLTCVLGIMVAVYYTPAHGALVDNAAVRVALAARETRAPLLSAPPPPPPWRA